jgi:hypothetical protein
MEKTTQKIQVAQHLPSGCRLINGRWRLDYEEEELIEGAETDYARYVDIVSEDDDNYNEDDCEQEHDEDYAVVEVEIEGYDPVEQQL